MKEPSPIVLLCMAGIIFGCLAIIAKVPEAKISNLVLAIICIGTAIYSLTNTNEHDD